MVSGRTSPSLLFNKTRLSKLIAGLPKREDTVFKNQSRSAPLIPDRLELQDTRMHEDWVESARR